MIPLHIKSLIEEKYGKSIRYPKDCEGLSADILTVCKERISASTLKRLFAFVKSTNSPNRHTLDVLAWYIGFPEWDSIPPPDTDNDINVPEINADVKPEIKPNRSRKMPILIGGIVVLLALLTYFVFDSPTKNDFTLTELPSMPEARAGGTMLVSGDCIYYIGGSDAEFMRNNLWCYDTASRKWLVKTPMPTARAEAACIEMNGIIYCFGGWRGNDSGETNIAEAFDIARATWSILPPLPHKITSASAVVLNNNIYIIGGTTGETNSHFYKYDPSDSSYAELPTFETVRKSASLVICHNRIFAVGGQSFTAGSYLIHNNLDEFIPGENKWIACTPLPQALFRSAVAADTDKMYVASGTSKIGDDSTGFINKLYIYDTRNATWTTSDLNWKSLGTVSVFCNNTIFCAGGHFGFPNPSNRFFKYSVDVQKE